MPGDLPTRPILGFTTSALPPEQLVPLVESLRDAFRLAKRGASALGYQRLRAARAEAIHDAPYGKAWAPELRRCWDQAVCWYERYAAPPPC